MEAISIGCTQLSSRDRSLIHETQDLFGNIVGGVVSPVLANVYLHELDLFIKTLKERFDQGKKRGKNPPYDRYTKKIARLRKEWDSLKGKEGVTQQLQDIKREIQQVDQLRKQLPSRNPFDERYKRLFYCRYADDFCIGIIGSLADAEAIKQQVTVFIQEMLKLTIAEEKSHIGHSRKGMTFVGYEVKTYSGDRIIRTKRGNRHTTLKSVSECIQLHIPEGKLQKFCITKGYGNYETTKAVHKKGWTHLSDAEIILAYNGELRGLANYYALALNAKTKMNKLAYIWRASLLKTLANKHKTSIKKTANQLKTDDGYALIIQEDKRTRVIKIFRIKDLRKPLSTDPQTDKQPNTYIWTLSRSEVIKRLNKGQCEYCTTTQGPFEVHHIRKLKDVAKGKALWQQMMAARYRKTLILCHNCHHQLHGGTLPDRDYFKKDVKGEPTTLKGVRSVLREGVG